MPRRYSESGQNMILKLNSYFTKKREAGTTLLPLTAVLEVFMDINEVGTEAAAVTSVSLTKHGGQVRFRVDVPFSFFIRHEETSTILFWGSIVIPYPNFVNL